MGQFSMKDYDVKGKNIRLTFMAYKRSDVGVALRMVEGPDKKKRWGLLIGCTWS